MPKFDGWEAVEPPNRKSAYFCRWLLTFNQSDKAYVAGKIDDHKELFKCAIVCDEVADTTGHPHCHCVCWMNSRKSMKQMKAIFGVEVDCRLIKRTFYKAWLYCTKQDKHPYILGEPPKTVPIDERGPSKTETFFSNIIADPSIENLQSQLEAMPGMGLHTKAAMDLISLRCSRMHEIKDDLEVVYFYGPSGSGKSSSAFGYLSDFTDYDRCSFTGHFINGYTMQKTVIFDDLQLKSADFPVEDLLKYLDKWPTTVNIKGGHLPWLATTIVITRCESPLELIKYKAWQGNNVAQLLRRITKLYRCWKDDDGYHTELVASNPRQEAVIVDLPDQSDLNDL